MVHLATIPQDQEVNAPLVEGMKKLEIETDGEDISTANVYGSRFAAQELPKHEIPDGEMPKEVRLL